MISYDFRPVKLDENGTQRNKTITAALLKCRRDPFGVYLLTFFLTSPNGKEREKKYIERIEGIDCQTFGRSPGPAVNLPESIVGQRRAVSLVRWRDASS